MDSVIVVIMDRLAYSFNQKKSFEPARSTTEMEKLCLADLNSFIDTCINQFDTEVDLFDIEDARVRLKQRKVYILLQKLDRGEVTIDKMLSEFGINQPEDFKRFYRGAIRLWHPDVWSGMGLNKDQISAINTVAQQLNLLRESLSVR